MKTGAKINGADLISTLKLNCVDRQCWRNRVTLTDEKGACYVTEIRAIRED